MERQINKQVSEFKNKILFPHNSVKIFIKMDLFFILFINDNDDDVNFFKQCLQNIHCTAQLPPALRPEW